LGRAGDADHIPDRGAVRDGGIKIEARGLQGLIRHIL
jgi:hypothetical protein